MSALEILKRQRERGRCVPVILMTDRESFESDVLGPNDRPDGLLYKPFSLRALHELVRELVSYHLELQDTSFNCGLLRYDYESRTAYIDGLSIKLSGGEKALLELFIGDEGRVIDETSLVDKLTSDKTRYYQSAINSEIEQLRHKLQRSGATISRIRGIGYSFRQSPLATQ